MKIKVGVSNRHIHLCKEDADILFGENYVFEKRNDLTQTGEFACCEVVKVSTDKYEFPYVRVLGPLRNYTQVEVSSEDSELLGINPPMRDSGDLENSESVWLEGPNGKIYKENCCIRANRHIHCSKLDNIGYKNGSLLRLLIVWVGKISSIFKDSKPSAINAVEATFKVNLLKFFKSGLNPQATTISLIIFKLTLITLYMSNFEF